MKNHLRYSKLHLFLCKMRFFKNVEQVKTYNNYSYNMH